MGHHAYYNEQNTPKTRYKRFNTQLKIRQSPIAWQTVNEESKRKCSVRAKLQAASQEERIYLWKEHFKNLLGKFPKVTDESITKIIDHQLNDKLG